MRTSVLFVLGALAFSILAGAIEALWARRERRLLKEKSTVVLHRLTQHRLRRVRYPLPARALYQVSLFVGCLLVTYVAIFLLKMLYRVVEHWF